MGAGVDGPPDLIDYRNPYPASDNGGAICNSNGFLALRGVKFSQNTVTGAAFSGGGFGGAIANFDEMEIGDSWFASNSGFERFASLVARLERQVVEVFSTQVV